MPADRHTPVPHTVPTTGPDTGPDGDMRAPLLSQIDPRIGQLVNDLIGRVADRWTMQILEALEEAAEAAGQLGAGSGPGQAGAMRFTAIGRAVTGISQKMLTQTLRHMERDGLVIRTVHPVIPPHVDYRLTDLGHGLAAAFCGVWTWAEANLDRIAAARADFDAKP